MRGTRWFGQGSTQYLSADAMQYYGFDPRWDWYHSSRWWFAVECLPLYVCFYYGRLAGVIVAVLPLAAVVSGGVRVWRLSGKLGRLLGFSALMMLFAQWLMCILSSLSLTASNFSFPFLSVGYYSLIVNMALVGVVCSVLRTDGLR